MRIKKNPEVLSALLDQEWCLFVPSTSNYLNLNSTGSFLWELLEDTDDFNLIVKKVFENYDISIEDCKEKVKSFFYYAEKKKILNIKTS